MGRAGERHDGDGEERRAVKRRGLIAGAAALVAGIAAKQVALPVAADVDSTYLQSSNVVRVYSPTGVSLATSNSIASIFTITPTDNGTGNVTGLLVQGAGNKEGIYTTGGVGGGSGIVAIGKGGAPGVSAAGGPADGHGVQATGSVAGNGVRATGGGSNSGTGVFADGGLPNGIGVEGLGRGSGIGVKGTGGSPHANGVEGYASGGYSGVAGYGGTGVYAQGGVAAQGGNGKGVGLIGITGNTPNPGNSDHAPNDIGVYGEAATGIGVKGYSSGSYGILGVTSAGAPYSGITGVVYSGTGAAFAGGASNPGAFAAYFTGRVNIDGPFFVNGVQKFTLKHADGTSRLVSGALSVEPTVEDFGDGKLSGEKASVAFDAEFAAVAETGGCRVYLTPLGDSKGLYIAAQSAAGFEVREQQGGASAVAFNWRAVAKPKAEGKVQRLAKYQQPDIKIPGINGEPPLAPPAPNPPAPPSATAPPVGATPAPTTPQAQPPQPPQSTQPAGASGAQTPQPAPPPRT